MRFLSLFSLLSLYSLSAHTQNYSKTIFRVAAKAPEKNLSIGEAESYSLALHTTGILPYKNPHSSNDIKGAAAFRYSNPAQLGFDFTYAVDTHWEIGAGVAYERFSSKVVLFSANPSVQRTQFIESYEWPFMVSARYNFNGTFWHPDAELAGGVSFGSRKYTEDFSSKSVTVRTAIPRVHALLGSGFAWDEKTSLHVQAGLYADFTPKKTFNDFNEAISSDNLVGTLVKASVRYRF